MWTLGKFKTADGIKRCIHYAPLRRGPPPTPLPDEADASSADHTMCSYASRWHSSPKQARVSLPCSTEALHQLGGWCHGWKKKKTQGGLQDVLIIQFHPPSSSARFHTDGGQTIRQTHSNTEVQVTCSMSDVGPTEDMSTGGWNNCPSRGL